MMFALLAPLLAALAPMAGQLSMIGPVLTQLAGPAQAVGQWALKNWRYVLIAALVGLVVLQHGCVQQAQHKLAAEKTAHAQDVATAKANDAAAKLALAKANDSVRAAHDQGLQDTAVAERAAQAAQARAVRASRTAAAIMARKALPGGSCPSIHSLRMETSQ